MKPKEFLSHLGDGFYVDYDMYQISIAVNSPENVVAYMDPLVLENFLLYVKKIHSYKIEIDLEHYSKKK